jgi:starch-binding outer membrane protein, SusD/RagB family
MNMASRHPLLVGTTVLALGAGVLWGCKDFLSANAASQGTLDQSTLSTLSGVEGSLIAAYRALDWNNGVGGNWGNSASNWVWGSVASDDAFKGSEASDQPQINDIRQYHWATPDAEVYLNEKWRGVYEGVSRANATLNLLKSVQTADPSAVPAATATGITGEAKFLRAHYHFEAYRMWGSIPYYREDDTDFRKANEAGSAVITDILKDLDDAIAALPLTPRNGEKGRASRWTAKAYKGRVQMYAGQYAAALTTFTDVVTNGPYALETSFDRVNTGFQSEENGKETIWAYQASANDGEPNGNNANYGNRLNFPHSGSPLGCCGFHQPSFNLVNYFVVDAAGLPLAITSPTTWNNRNTELDAAATAVGSGVFVDPRLDLTVGRDGVPYKDWGMHKSDWIRSLAYGGPYSPKKNVHENSSGAQSNVGWVNTQLNADNVHLFRYADLLLMMAEADVETNNLPAAIGIVNQIRARAAQRAQGCGVPTDATLKAFADTLVAHYPQCAGQTAIYVPINDAHITWATYRVNPYPLAAPYTTDQATARAVVRAERRLELAMEGQRFFDLKRYGQAVATQVLNDYLTAEKVRMPAPLSGAENFAARHMFFPIPQLQIELSKVGTTPKLTQNPGW